MLSVSPPGTTAFPTFRPAVSGCVGPPLYRTFLEAVGGAVARGMTWAHQFFPPQTSACLVVMITYVCPYQGENGHKKTDREEGNDQCEPPPERQGNHGKKGFEAWGPRGMPLRRRESNTQIMHDSVHPPFPLPPVACTCAFSCGSVPDGHAIVASYTLGEPSQS